MPQGVSTFIREHGAVLALIIVGAALCAAGFYVEELRGVKIDWAGAGALGYGLFEHLQQRSRRKMAQTLEGSLLHESVMTVMSIGGRIDRLESNLDDKHKENRASHEALLMAIADDRRENLRQHEEHRLRFDKLEAKVDEVVEDLGRLSERVSGEAA